MSETETISAYELTRLLESVPAMVGKVPAIIDRNLKETCESTIPDVIAKINRTMEACKAFEDALSAREEELCRQIEAAYNAVAKAHQSLAERIKALPAMPERLNIPYNFKEILDLAERAERMTPETWNRVIAFAQAAGGK